jgi:hypothetical protein
MGIEHQHGKVLLYESARKKWKFGVARGKISLRGVEVSPFSVLPMGKGAEDVIYIMKRKCKPSYDKI